LTLLTKILATIDTGDNSIYLKVLAAITICVLIITKTKKARFGGLIGTALDYILKDPIIFKVFSFSKISKIYATKLLLGIVFARREFHQNDRAEHRYRASNDNLFGHIDSALL
jgi:hypothetical protein